MQQAIRPNAGPNCAQIVQSDTHAIKLLGVAQAYIGDKLGYDENPIMRNMTIAVTDAGAVDGADIINEVVFLHLNCISCC